MSQSPSETPASNLPLSLPPREPLQDGHTRRLSSTVDMGGPQTMKIRQSHADPSPPRPRSSAVPSLPTQPMMGQLAMSDGRVGEPPHGPTPEATPVNPASATEKHSGRMWIGWALVLLVIAVVVVIAYAVYGLAPLLITTMVPVAVVVIGIVLVLLSLLITVGRRRERRAAERVRREAQQEAWARHQQFLRRLDHELKNPLTAVRAAVADLPQAHPQELQARWVRRDRARHSSVEVLSQDCDRVGTGRRQRLSNVLGVTKMLISLRQRRRPRRCQGKNAEVVWAGSTPRVEDFGRNTETRQQGAQSS